MFFDSPEYIGSLPAVKRKINFNEIKSKVSQTSSGQKFYSRPNFDKSVINYMDSNAAN